MRPYYKLPRLYVSAPLQEGAELPLSKEQVHHLAHVLRLRAGAQILLFNGHDGEWLATLFETGKKRLSARLEQQTRKQLPSSDLIYCFAPLKSARLDYLVQKATEMGAGMLQPVITQFTQLSQPNLEKMQANVTEAAQQCGLLSLPQISPPLKLAELLNHWPSPRHLIFCDELLANEESEAILTLAQLEPVPISLLIGPEGGFSDTERELLRSYPFVTAISLGPRILRADTAAVAALALINAVFEH